MAKEKIIFITETTKINGQEWKLIFPKDGFTWEGTTHHCDEYTLHKGLLAAVRGVLGSKNYRHGSLNSMFIKFVTDNLYKVLDDELNIVGDVYVDTENRVVGLYGHYHQKFLHELFA